MAKIPRTCWLVLMLLVSMSVFVVGEKSAVSAEMSRTPHPLFAFGEPAISPDHSEIAFISGSDIWAVPARGGDAHLLVSSPAAESRPIYSPDGKQLAFVSTRTGGGDIYILTIATGDLKRLTFDDGLEQLDAWSPDGKWIYFSTTSHDISGMNDIYRVSIEGGTPMPVSADRYANEFFSALSPDGTTLAITARGIASSQWWRKGHSHLDESQIWLVHPGAPPRYQQVTDGDAKEMWPMWGPAGKQIFYVSDRSGAQNIWARVPGQPARQVTQFKDGRVLWPNISYDGKEIVFERHFGIWKMDTASGKVQEVKIVRQGAPDGPAVEHLTLTNQIQELALSPDGKKVAFIVHGEVFAASAKEGGEAMRVTHTPEKESQISWSPDSKSLAYVSDRSGTRHLYLYNFVASTETQLTKDAKDDDTPVFSPDGKLLAFERDGKELRVLDLATKQDRVLATGYLERPPLNSERPFVWSPDNRYIAFMNISGKMFKNVEVVAVAGGESKAVSFLANGGNNTVSWSPDGTYLLFDTGQRTEPGQLARIDLIPRTPKFREDQFRDLFKEEMTKNTSPAVDAATPTGETTPKPAAKPAVEVAKKTPVKPVEVVFDGIRERLSLIPTGLDVNSASISPDGKWALLVANAAGQQNLYVYSLDELAKEPAVAKQLTAAPGPKRDAQFSPDSKEVFYLDQGKINVVSLESHQPKPLAVTAEMDVDFAKEKMEVFEQAWTIQRDDFFDKSMNGVNWQAVHDEYAPRIAGAGSPDELRRLLSLMIGELNSSHSGIGAPPGSVHPEMGKIGLRFDPAEFELHGKLRISEIIPLSPADLSREIKVGDFLLAVDGNFIHAHTNLDELLSHKIGRRVVLTVASSAEGAGQKEVAVKPVNQMTEKGLVYREWVEQRRAYVDKISGGRLGYIHMVDMSSNALERMYLDLDAQNQSHDGVVIDVRNNNGGFVNVYAIDVLARRSYLTFTPRGLFSAPSRTVLGQRALEKPTILVTNQHSLSDAEDFTEGYRTLHLGKVVGEPTAGWIIYTSGAQLIDGSFIRIPFMRVTAHDGTPMEMHPRPVDIAVSNPIGESYTGHDAQLDAAVNALLQQINKK